MSTRVEQGVAASRPGLHATPGRAPACGARTRAAGWCLGLAMANGRCRIHGGASTGPRSAAGLARMVAAKTTHGRFAMSGAPERLAQRFVWTFMARAGLTAEATMLREYLPGGMAARLDSAPEELMPPKHPSQVAFEALAPLTPRTGLPLGLGRRARRARARLGVGGGVADGAAVARRGRAAERLVTQAETAAQAPWRAAIVAARELKHAVQEARGRMGEVRNDPICGVAMRAAGDRTRGVRNDPIRGTAVGAEGRTRGSRNDPIGGTAVGAMGQSRDPRNDPICGTAVAAAGRTQGSSDDPIGGTAVGAMGQSRDPRNDPICGSAMEGDGRTRGSSNDPICGTAVPVPAAGAPLDARVDALAERLAGETAGWAPGSPGLGEALARELEKRRLRAAAGLRGNDPVRGDAADAGVAGRARVAPAR